MSISRGCRGLLVTALAVTTGCGAAAGERGDAAAAAATGFTYALQRADGRQACALLAPRTLDELEKPEQTPCAQAVTEERLPAGGAVRRVDVYGGQARVVLTGDTLFLAHFPSGWKVTAAGCTPRPEQPYDCTIKGG
ncbi:lipoprotein [Streptomyces viridochromogenes]|uniref:Lipoprotein n=1 Tax=Streptomyces viridochromogenes TaxID=1938 RepID=A0A0J7ZMP5_STRVR|nr:hypothetical protein [Streptomyces viridochromogenes]KMS77301.1 lipoprotein [Streptomyces viridochromogenes]KOG19024.1 lipoprotein [Streptomyces viridochromogenes]KOG19263.1 lipoprotein [Streptomyces viridochromogenes]